METTVHTVNNFLCETMRWRPKRLRRSSSVDTRTGYWSLWEGECVCSALIKGPDRRSVSVRNRSFYKPWSTTSGNKTWHPPWLCLLVLSCHPDRHKYQLMIVIKAAGGVNPAWVSSLWWDLLSADVRRASWTDGKEELGLVRRNEADWSRTKALQEVWSPSRLVHLFLIRCVCIDSRCTQYSMARSICSSKKEKQREEAWHVTRFHFYPFLLPSIFPCFLTSCSHFQRNFCCLGDILYVDIWADPPSPLRTNSPLSSHIFHCCGLLQFTRFVQSSATAPIQLASSCWESEGDQWQT